MKARIIIGANYGDEGKGTVVAKYTKESTNVLNILTNGGSQRGHSILTKDGSITYQHFGSGTYYGADSYYSRFFIINPVQFASEYEHLIVRPNHIYRDAMCRWTTIYDMLANHITEEQKDTHGSCCMGIWNTIKRIRDTRFCPFDLFMCADSSEKRRYLLGVKQYYERQIEIPESWKNIWNSDTLLIHFLQDCWYMYRKTTVSNLKKLHYDNLIFENGQGLLLCDTGKDTFDTTPSNTGIRYSLELLEGLDVDEITAHYVSRTYLTRHGDGILIGETSLSSLSSNIQEDRTNHYNEGQGEFRYGKLDIDSLYGRIRKDAHGIPFKLELTHCDEFDNTKEIAKLFHNFNTYESPII